MSSCDYTACNPVLLTGPDVIISDSSKSLHWNVLEWLKNNTYSEIQQRKANGFKFGFTIPIEGVPTPFDLDSNFSEEDFNRLQSAIQSGRIEYFSDDVLQHFVSKIYNPDIYQTWSECIQGMIKTCSNGLQTNIKYNGNQIVITLRYVPINDQDTFPIVENFYVPPNATCNTGCLSIGDTIGNEHLILITRNNDEQSMAIIDTNKGGESIQLKKAEPPPPPPSQPPSQPHKPHISESERREAIQKVYEFVINKWIQTNGNLGPGGIIRVETFEAEGSKVHFKILVHYVFSFMGIPKPVDDYMEETIDLADLNPLNDRDISVYFHSDIDPAFDKNLYISLRDLAEVILAVVDKNH